MAMGVPVVSSRLAGVPEVVSHGVTGLMVEPGNVAELASAIQELGSDPDACRGMGTAGRD